MTITGIDRAAALRDIAAAVLLPEELLGMHAGDYEPPAERTRTGMFGPEGSYSVRGFEVVLDGWRGLTETVDIDELLDLAAAAGTDARANRLQAALADHDRAHRDAARYIQRHGGHALTAEQQRAPEWVALLARMNAVRTAAAAWWGGPVVEVPGEQLDLLAQVDVCPGVS